MKVTNQQRAAAESR